MIDRLTSLITIDIYAQRRTVQFWQPLSVGKQQWDATTFMVFLKFVARDPSKRNT